MHAHIWTHFDLTNIRFQNVFSIQLNSENWDVGVDPKTYDKLTSVFVGYFILKILDNKPMIVARLNDINT